MPFNFFHLVYRTPSNQVLVNDFAPCLNMFSCFVLNFTESRISCFQLIFSVIDFCSQLVEGFFTSTRNTFVFIWERFHTSSNSHRHGMTTFNVKDNLFLFGVYKMWRKTHAAIYSFHQYLSINNSTKGIS